MKEVPDGDVLVFAGDLMNDGWDWSDIERFNAWFSALPHKHKLAVAGNHDWLFEKNRDAAKGMLDASVTYLEDSGCEIDGFKFWGSPVQPTFGNWAFNVQRGGNIRRHWNLIPDDIDVLITHGPPLGYRDWSHLGGPNLGCADLRIAVERIKPQLHVFGHIHGGAGKGSNGVTTFVNASFVNEAYRPTFAPTVIDLEAPRG